LFEQQAFFLRKWQDWPDGIINIPAASSLSGELQKLRHFGYEKSYQAAGKEQALRGARHTPAMCPHREDHPRNKHAFVCLDRASIDWDGRED
jgi:hypothetical protein